MFDFNDVAIFVQVVRDGSFTAAGRHLSMPANTVSRRVQQLETALDARLLQRTTRQLSLTAAGRGFFEQAVGGISSIEQGRQSVLDAGREPNGCVRVAAPSDFFECFPIALMEEFLHRYPRVQLAFTLSDAHTDLIAEGIDLAFRTGELPDSALLARKLADNHLYLVASPVYLETHSAPAELAQLSEHVCLIRSGQNIQQVWRLDGPDGAQDVRVQGRFAANTVQSLLQAARSGLGIALLPALLIGNDLAQRRLLPVLPQYRQELGGIYVVSTSRQRSLAVNALIEFVELGSKPGLRAEIAVENLA